MAQLTNDMSGLRDDVKSILNTLQPPPLVSSPNHQHNGTRQNIHHHQQQKQPPLSQVDKTSIDGSGAKKQGRGAGGPSKKGVHFLPRLHFHSGKADNQKTRLDSGDNSDFGGVECRSPDSQADTVAPPSEYSQNSISPDVPVSPLVGGQVSSICSDSDVDVFIDETECNPPQHRRHLTFLTTDL